MIPAGKAKYRPGGQVKITSMKNFLKLVLFASALAGMAGCHNLGYNSPSTDTTLTPGVSSQTIDRTYDERGNPSVTPPVPGSDDPNSPNFRGSK